MKKIIKLPCLILFFLFLCLSGSTLCQAASIRISMKQAKIHQGETLQLSLLGTTRKPVWLTSNDTIVSVNSNGRVLAKKPGCAIVAAKIGTSKYRCVLTVSKRDSKNSFLKNLKKKTAGTVLKTSQIDFSRLQLYFTSSTITPEIQKRIYKKSYIPNPNISLSSLRYIKVLHYNFDHKIQVGELIVNQKIAGSIRTIFQQLFEAEYEIQSLYLIDNFWRYNGTESDRRSMKANNSSAFCYRVIAGSSRLSNHARGLAVDINPVQNPYAYRRYGSWYCSDPAARPYLNRSSGRKHIITTNDLCYRLFRKYGFTWGGNWSSIKDYQHFEHK